MLQYHTGRGDAPQRLEGEGGPGGSPLLEEEGGWVPPHPDTRVTSPSRDNYLAAAFRDHDSVLKNRGYIHGGVAFFFAP